MLNKSTDCIYLPANVSDVSSFNSNLAIKGKSTSGYYFDSLGLPINHGFKVPDASLVPHSTPLIPSSLGWFFPAKIKSIADKAFTAYIHFDWRHNLNSVTPWEYEARYYIIIGIILDYIALLILVVVATIDVLIFDAALGISLLPYFQQFFSISSNL